MIDATATPYTGPLAAAIVRTLKSAAALRGCPCTPSLTYTDDGTIRIRVAWPEIGKAFMLEEGPGTAQQTDEELEKSVGKLVAGLFEPPKVVRFKKRKARR